MGCADGKWEVVGLDEFLIGHSPALRMHVKLAGQFPPLHVINEELKTGGSNLGMSGGCFWKPFEITESEYRELADEMLTSPRFDLEYDLDLEKLESLSKWCGAVLSKHNFRKRGD